MLNAMRLTKKRLEAETGFLLKPVTGMTCLRPFYYMNISIGGVLSPCCPGLLAMPIGIESTRRSFNDIWNGGTARMFRKAMYSTRLDSVCRRERCPFFMNNLLPRMTETGLNMSAVAVGLFPEGLADDLSVIAALKSKAVRLDYTPRTIALACDRRCNLSCASCRSTRAVKISNEESAFLDTVNEYVHSIGEHLLEIELSGSGEVFYSPFGLTFLRSLSRSVFPSMKVHIVTNGQLLTAALWESLGRAQSFIKRIDVSIDAATKETYEAIRIGASWNRLCDNLLFMSQLRQTGVVDMLTFNFVVSVRNFREIPQFLHMAEKYGADMVVMTALQDWGNGMRYNFEKEAVHLLNHPLHGEFINTIQSVREKEHSVLFGIPGIDAGWERV
jgi:molybdenum cofactor biosynthesis enzyme MoaA